MKELVVRAPFCVRSGYETLSDTICIELSKNGIDVYPLSTNGEIQNPLVKKLAKPITRSLTSKLELCILPIQADLNDYNVMFRIPKIGKRVFFTMWESTQLSMNIVDLLNRGSAVIVPNSWNQENFEVDGVTVPIRKCPLFVDTSVYNYHDHIDSGFFTFGTGNADPRKRLNDVMRCFSKAFPASIKDVKLKVKIDNQDLNRLIRFSDDRIEILTTKLSKEKMAEWYHSIDVFVSGAASEGWGLMQHEAMSCGRPLVACEYSGLKEFFDDEVGVPVKFTEVPAEWSWGYSNGFWSKFDESDMVEKLRWCYNNPEKIEKMGLKSAEQGQCFNIPHFVNKLTEILEEFED